MLPAMRKLLATATVATLLFAPLACDSGGDGDAGDDGGEQLPPTDAAALMTWLEGNKYSGWEQESEPHLSDGPHVVQVKVHVNDALLASLNASATEHPVGSAAVKELYDADGAASGWAVSVKVSEGLSNNAWYWYEVSGGTVLGDAVGDPSCVGCHSLASNDHFNSSFPAN